jgi:hypothetical protein
MFAAEIEITTQNSGFDLRLADYTLLPTSTDGPPQAKNGLE